MTLFLNSGGLTNKFAIHFIRYSYMSMSLPPLRSLRVLEAVTRLGGVGRAAAELGVSQPAVSQQLRVIEDYFGRPMVKRTASGVSIDEDVELFGGRLQRAFAEIERAAEAFQDQADVAANQLTISLLASFAQRWLILRLAGFQSARPEIDIRLMTTSTPSDLGRRDADLSIRCGDGAWAGHNSRFLIENRIFPIASPTYLAANPLRRRDDLRKAILIQVESPPRNRDWGLWLKDAGLAEFQPKSWQTYANSTHALEAAAAGLGVAMGHTPFVVDSLSSGLLVKPFDFQRRDDDGDYFLVHRRGREIPRRISLFCDWLTRNAPKNI